MILEFEDEKGLLDKQTRELMQRCADAAQRTEGVSCPLSVFISVVDDEEIRTINREQRSKDASTDVLSFPTVNYPKGKTAGKCEPLLREEYYPDFMSRWHEAFVAEMAAFTGHVRDNTKPTDLTVYDGTAVSEAAYRCKESFETGKMLPIR